MPAWPKHSCQAIPAPEVTIDQAECSLFSSECNRWKITERWTWQNIKSTKLIRDMFDWYLFRRNIVNLQKPPKWWAPSLFGWIRYFPFIKGFCQHSQMWYLQGLRNLDAPRDRIVLDFGSSDLVSSGVFWTGIILPSDIYETWNRLWFSKVRLWIPKTELGNFCEWSLYNTKQDQKKTITVLWILQ